MNRAAGRALGVVFLVLLFLGGIELAFAHSHEADHGGTPCVFCQLRAERAAAEPVPVPLPAPARAPEAAPPSAVPAPRAHVHHAFSARAPPSGSENPA